MPTVQSTLRTYRQTDGRLTIAIPRFALHASRVKNKSTFAKVIAKYAFVFFCQQSEAGLAAVNVL